MTRASVPAVVRSTHPARPLNLATVQEEDQPAIRRMLEWEGPPPDRDVYLWADELLFDLEDWLKARKGKHGFGMNREALVREMARIWEISDMIETYERLFNRQLN